MSTKNIFIVLMMTLCAYAFLARAQESDTVGVSTSISDDIAIDTLAGASTNISEDTAAGASTSISDDIAADTLADTSTSISEDIAADTSINASTDIAKNASVDNAGDDDDDDLDDELLLASFVIDTSAVKKPDLVRREHNYKRQVRLAIYMMIFITVAFTTAQSWNPK